MIFPQRPIEKFIQIKSELDHSSYPLKLESKFENGIQAIQIMSNISIKNRTDSNLGLYVQSGSDHWKLLSPTNMIDNPFENCVKVKDLMCHSVFSVPLALTKDALFFIKPSNMR